MTPLYPTITDARTAVTNAGVVDWDWGRPDLAHRQDDVLSALTDYVYHHQRPVDAPTIAGYVREVLCQDPRDYDLHRDPEYSEVLEPRGIVTADRIRSAYALLHDGDA